MTKFSKALGIDYGQRRIGLALAAADSMPVAYKVVANDKNFFNLINQLIAAEGIDLIVVGMPFSLDGGKNERTKITEQFISDLSKNTTVKIVTSDERLTTRLYQKQAVKQDIDKHSAAAILESYINQSNA